MSSALLFVALCLASYRVWRLAGKDEITQFWRGKIALRSELAWKLIECEWCLGSWLSVAAVYSTHRWLVPLEPHWLLWAVAVSCVVGLIGTAVDK